MTENPNLGHPNLERNGVPVGANSFVGARTAELSAPKTAPFKFK